MPRAVRPSTEPGGLSRPGAFGRRFAHRLVAGALGVALAFGQAAPALAEPTPAQREQARKLAAEGFDALERKDYATAEQRFRRADALVHAPTLVVDHARSLVGLGRLVEAHERYELVLREGVGPSAPWQWKLAHADAARELEALKPRLAWLTLRVKGPREPQVLVDNKPVPLAALGVRRATDPGTHSVSVRAPGFEPKEEIVTLDEGQNASLEVELTPVTRFAEAPPPAPVASSTEPVAPEPRAAASRDHTLAYVLLGVGGLGLAAGVVTGGLALGARSDLADQCRNGVCRPRSPRELDAYRNDIDQYHLWGTLSGIGFGVGVAAVGTGVTLLLLDGGSESRESASFVEAYVGVGSAGMKGRF